MKIALVTDSTCDWHFEDYDVKNVRMIPLHVRVGEKVFLDQYELSCDEYYDYMIEGKEDLSTSQPSPGEFIDVYNDLADQGFDAIVSMHIAETISGTCSSARIAADSVDVDVHVIDSLGSSCELGLLVDQAVRMRDQGATLEQLTTDLGEYAKRSQLYFSPATLDALVNGGRFPAAQAEQANLLNIRIVFDLTDNGAVGMLDKVKGAKGVVNKYVELLSDTIEKYGPCYVRIMQARSGSSVDKLVTAFDEAGLDYELVSVDSTGGIIACHTGVGCLGFGVMPKGLN